MKDAVKETKRAMSVVGTALLVVGVGLLARMAGATWPATAGVAFLVWAGVFVLCAIGAVEDA